MTANPDLGKLILRLMIGGMMLLHGIAKIKGDLAFIMNKLVEAGFPSFFAYGVYLGEIVAPILIILGLKTRLASFVIIITMIFAIYLVMPNSIFAITKTGAWAIELQMFYILSSISLILLGAGKISFDKN